MRAALSATVRARQTLSAACQPHVPASLFSSRRLVVPRTASPITSEVATAPAPQEQQMAGGKKEDVKEMGGEMLQKSVVNTPLVRAGAMLGAVAAAAGSTLVLPSVWAKFLHVASYGIWIGTNVYTTFVIGLTLFKVLPRQTFGRTQAKLFPIYFNITSGTNALVLATLLLSKDALATSGTAAITLGATLVANLLNQLVVEPLATKLMFQRYELENKEDKNDDDKAQIAKLYKSFGKYHGISSLLNLLVTMGALSHGVFLAGRLAL